MVIRSLPISCAIRVIELENLFFYELDKLSEEDKKKALEHVRYLRYLAEKENKNKRN
jgi:hypothetical protein